MHAGANRKVMRLIKRTLGANPIALVGQMLHSMLNLKSARSDYWRLQMDIAADLALFRAERDALAFLGLLSSLYLRFDPPISRGDGGRPNRHIFKD